MDIKKNLEKNCILFVDDDFFNREIMKNIFSAQYECLEAENGLEGLQQIEANVDRLCAILLDVSMPVMTGTELLRILNSRGIISRIPVFLITVEADEIAQESYELGVMDVISKPVTPFVIQRRVQNVIELFRARETLSETVLGQAIKLQENADTIDIMHRNTIEALASAIEFRDVESGAHTNRIYSLTKEILTKTEFGKNYSEEEIENMAIASIMHDVGKIAITDIILNKPGRLTPEEFEIMKIHTIKGEMLMGQISQMQEHPSYKYAGDIARHHHERWDGRGYPDGLKGEEITDWAQVVSIADVYDALLSPRVYKKPFTPDKALDMIVNGECGVFNPKLIESFLQVEPEIRKWYENGELVTEEEELAKIIAADKQSEEKVAAATARSNREVSDVLLLMAAVQSVYDMIICVNLSKNSFYMIDNERFLTHKVGNDGVFDELVAEAATSVPESHRQAFADTFSREPLLKAYADGKKSVELEYPQLANDGKLRTTSTSVLFRQDPRTGDILQITLSRYRDNMQADSE